jgi:N-formylglutamate amidohydrolase
VTLTQACMSLRAFTFHNFDTANGPVLLSVPHAGRDYAAYERLLRVPLAAVQPLEDRYADLLADVAIAQNTPTIIAHAPRLAIDLNRAPEDLDPAMIRGQGRGGAPLTTKALGGLGLIPSRLATTGSLWRSALDPDDVDARVREVYDPWHSAIAAQLNRTRAIWGGALLIDLHSMPSLDTDDAPQIVIGDRFGRSASAHIAEAAASVLTGAGYRVASNVPYAGGHMVKRHANPAANVHALQIEIDRRLYLDAAFNHPGPGIHAIQRLVMRLIAELSAELAPTLAAAAE